MLLCCCCVPVYYIRRKKEEFKEKINSPFEKEIEEIDAIQLRDQGMIRKETDKNNIHWIKEKKTFIRSNTTNYVPENIPSENLDNVLNELKALNKT